MQSTAAHKLAHRVDRLAGGLPQANPIWPPLRAGGFASLRNAHSIAEGFGHVGSFLAAAV
jgi:hypothetical protein